MTEKKCDMIGCRKVVFKSVSDGPGTYLSLCKECFDAYESEKYKNEH